MKRKRFTEEQVIGVLKEHEAGDPEPRQTPVVTPFPQSSTCRYVGGIRKCN